MQMGRARIKAREASPSQGSWGASRRITDRSLFSLKRRWRLARGVCCPHTELYILTLDVLFPKSIISSLSRLFSTLPSFLRCLLGTSLGQGKTLEIN